MVRYLVLLPLALVLAACGGGGGGALSLDPVAAAATKTAKSGGEHMTFQVRVRLPGPGGSQSFTMTGNGDFDAAKHVGRASLRFSGLPQIGRRAEEILDGTVVYVRFPFLEGRLPSGKRWLKLDLAKQGRAMGIDFNSLMQSSTSDPTQMLRYLEAASTGVEKVGTETVAGATTTHYSATVDFDKLAQARPSDKSSIRRLEQLTGVKYVPVDVWIDRDGYVRKVKESLTMYPIPQGPSTRMVMSFEFSAFGKRVSVTPPPADEVLDATKLAQSGAGG
jgi:hypothetical protein